MAERLGESRNDASDTNKSNRTQRQPKNIFAIARDGEAVETPSETSAGETRGGEEHQASAASKSRSGSARASVVQAVQDRMGGDRGADSERARHALRVPVLPEIAPRAGTGARLQKDAASAVGSVAPRGGIGIDGTLTEKGTVC
jgi:hypothetical protein